jgi:hypothetical protein
MADRATHEQRVKQLVAQDTDINENRIQEFRIQLEQTLEFSEAKVKLTRRRILIALTVYWIAIAASWYAFSHLGNATVDPKIIQLRELILIPLNLVSLVTFVILALLIALYLFKYWPRVSRTRFDVQTTMILELQEQVRSLAVEIGGRRQE